MSQWAADPFGRFELRYYDGARWTEHVSTGGTQTIDAPVGSAPFGQQFGQPQRPSGPFAGPGAFDSPPVVAAPMGYQPYAAVAMAPRSAASGKLIAAGVLTIIQAALTLIAGLWMLSVVNGDGEFLDDYSGGAFTAIALVIVAIGAALLTGGIGCCRSSTWGRILVIVLQSILLALMLLGMANGGSSSEALFPLGYCATALGLAIAGKPSR